jgi:hypothetical protein
MSATVPAGLGIGTRGWYPADGEVARLGVGESALIARATRRLSFGGCLCNPLLFAPGQRRGPRTSEPRRARGGERPTDWAADRRIAVAGARVEILVSDHAPDDAYESGS